jgi:hypothetical protein
VKRSDLRVVAGAVLAVVVPAALLELTLDEGRRAAGLSAAPFAWRRIMLAHLVAALPLGLIVAARIRSFPALSGWPRWPWLVLGAAAAGIAALASDAAGDALARSELGFLPLLLLRALVAFSLVLPWCVAVVDPPTESRPRPRGVTFAIGLGLAIVPCGLFTNAVSAARTEEAAALLTQRRLLRADWVVTGLCELGSARPILSISPEQVRKRLAASLPALRRQQYEPMPAWAAPAVRIYRAVVLVQLEHLDEAADMLRPLVPGDRVATLMLAAIYSDQKHWTESDALYTAILERLLPLAGSDEKARSDCRTAFDGLADNARLSHRPAAAEAVLNRALEELPADTAHFHFLLGRHFHDAGRIGLALHHLQTVAQLEPASAGPAHELIRQIRTSTPGCLTLRHGP